MSLRWPPGNLTRQLYQGPFPQLIKRYIDDIVGGTSLPCQQLQQFIDFVSNFHPVLQFTYEIADTSLTFLDMQLTISDDRLSTSILCKATDSHSFLNCHSSHRYKTKNATPYSQLLCLRCLCSNDLHFQTKSQKHVPSSSTMAILHISSLQRITRITERLHSK